MKYLMTLLVFFIIQNQAWSNSIIKKEMQEVIKNYIELMPYIYDKKEINYKDVQKRIKNIKNAFEKSSHYKTLNTSNFSPLLKSINETFNDIYLIKDKKQDDFIRYRLLGVRSLCISCHSQLPQEIYKPVHNNYEEITKKYIKNDKDNAYLSYFFRDYKKAIFYFKKDFQKKRSKGSLLKLLKTYLVNLNDKKSAIELLEELSNGNSSLKKEALSWKVELSQHIKSRAVSMNKQAWIRKLISNYLVPRKTDLLNRVSDQSLMISYQLQRIFYNYIVYHPNSTIVPDLLYWLGILENKDRDLELYTLGEMFFEQCITRYPKSAIAPRCLGAYKDALYEGFTGSSGTHIPNEYLEKLQKYKQLINEKK